MKISMSVKVRICSSHDWKDHVLIQDVDNCCPAPKYSKEIIMAYVRCAQRHSEHQWSCGGSEQHAEERIHVASYTTHCEHVDLLPRGSPTWSTKCPLLTWAWGTQWNVLLFPCAEWLSPAHRADPDSPPRWSQTGAPADQKSGPCSNLSVRLACKRGNAPGAWVGRWLKKDAISLPLLPHHFLPPRCPCILRLGGILKSYVQSLIL